MNDSNAVPDLSGSRQNSASVASRSSSLVGDSSQGLDEKGTEKRLDDAWFKT